MDNYCEYKNVACGYVMVCKDYDEVCAKEMLGDYFDKEGYKPEDILIRIKRYKEMENK